MSDELVNDELAARDRLIVTLQAELASLEERVTTIEHELHDGPLQRVIAARMELQALMASPGLTEQLLRNLEGLDESLEVSVQQVREILQGGNGRQTYTEFGLDVLCREFTEPGFHVALDGEAELEDVEEDLLQAIVMILREIIWNARKHSGANGASVKVERTPGQLLIQVEDQGKGFLTDQVPEDSFGLCTVLQRARTFDLEVTIASTPGEGTRVSVRKALQ